MITIKTMLITLIEEIAKDKIFDFKQILFYVFSCENALFSC